MRTSIVFSESVLEEAKRVSKEEGVSLKSLAEEGLRLAVEKHRHGSAGKRFRMVTFGSSEDKDIDLSWDQIRDLVYPTEKA